MSDEEETPTLFREPRKSAPLIDGGQERVYVFSYPDPQEGEEWGKARGIPRKYWEEDRKRWKAIGPYIIEALKLPKAPKSVLEALVPAQPQKTV